ncbi:hypothetical protein B0H19DRAFT_1275427 [Mycena capillaripes]|nr:hypothetical protein B0H19DRAFT_1275427 [Mycena capillaripes]
MALHTVDEIVEYTIVAAKALQDVAVAMQIPFLNRVCTLCLALAPIVQNTKIQKERCLLMVEEIHEFLCALTSLCFSSDDIRSPKLLDQIVKYSLTLQKFHSCMRAQQGLGIVKRLFKQGEIAAELDSCGKELRSALEIFTINHGVGLPSALVELNIDTERRHQELLELLSSQSVSSNDRSSIRTSSLNTSSGSLSLLPASPKIFHGRESELAALIATLLSNPARAIILGPGGMGKTTLAMAGLHHPAMIDKYRTRHFISCESANSAVDLVTNIGLHLGLEPSAQLSKIIIAHFKLCEPCLLVLDNFETPWESLESRGQVEELISLLAEIPSLALLITMRGAERPGKVKWNRPFLPPLDLLSLSASRQIFVDVADAPGAGEEAALDELLHLSGNLPLAVNLMANIASFEGYSETLARWQIENIALLSDGHDKSSNLEKSITLSLNSPRLSSSPHVKNLISLLSLLPDGILAEDIIASKVPIPDIRKWQSLLLRTSLAYIDVNGRLKAPLRIYFQDLLELWQSLRGLSSGDVAPALVAYLGNINELMLQGLFTEDKPALTVIGHSIITLNHFSATMLQGDSPLLQRLPHLIAVLDDAGLRWKYTSSCIGNPELNRLIENVDASIEEGVRYFTKTRSLSEAVHFYRAAARYYCPRSVHKAMEFTHWALSLARQAGDIELQLISMETEFEIAYTCTDSNWALEIAQKARDIAQFPSNYWEYRFTRWEAWGTCCAGNFSRALDLCAHAEELLVYDSMEGSDRYLGILDIRADVYFLQTDYIAARQCHQQIISQTSPVCSPWFHANSLLNIAHLDILTECELTGILANLWAAQAVYEGLGHRKAVTCSFLAAEVQLYIGETENARLALEECLSKSRGLYPDLPLYCLAALGDPTHKIYGTMNNFRWAVVYLGFVQKTKNPAGKLHALRCLADIYKSLDDGETALNLFHTALQGGTKMGIYRLRAECMVGIGDIMKRCGDAKQAKEMWTSAQPLFVRSSRTKDAAAVQVRLEQLAHSHTLPPSQDRSVAQTANSLLGKLVTFLAPDRAPLLEAESAVDDPGTSTEVQTKIT